MRHEELVLAALSYRRNVGASLDDIRNFVFTREEQPQTSESDAQALAQLGEQGIAVQIGNLWFLTPGAYRMARGSNLSPRIKDEDAWILLSLLHQHGRSNLQDIIATADYINHAIPSLEEIHGALNRLDAARLIKRPDDRFVVTQSALDLFAKVEASCKKNMIDQLGCLRRIMDCPCCGVELKAVQWRVNISPAEYDAAVSSYATARK